MLEKKFQTRNYFGSPSSVLLYSILFRNLEELSHLCEPRRKWETLVHLTLNCGSSGLTKDGVLPADFHLPKALIE